MALQTLDGGPLSTPPIPIYDAGPPAFVATGVLNETTDRLGVVLQAPQTGNIDKIGFLTGTVTTPGDGIDARIESVSTSTGFPAGLLASNTNAIQADPASDTWYEVTLTAAAAVTLGQMIAVVLQPGGANAINLIIKRLPVVTPAAIGNTYGFIILSGTTYFASGSSPVIALHYDTTNEWVYLADHLIPIKTLEAAVAINTGTGSTTGTRRGLLFQVPWACTLRGFRVRLAVAGNYDLELYNAAGTTKIATLASLDKDQQYSAANQVKQILFPGQALAANTNYRIVVTPTTSSSVTFYEYTVDNVALWGAVPGGAHLFSTAYINSAWDDTMTTRRPWASLLLSAFDDGASVTLPDVKYVYHGVDRGDAQTGTLHASTIAAAAGSGSNLSAGILKKDEVVDDVTGTYEGAGGTYAMMMSRVRTGY